VTGVPGASGGHNRKPTSLKILEGTYRRDRANPLEPQPPTGIPKPPKWLRKEARGYWRAHARALKSMGVLTLVDGQALAALANAEADYAEAMENRPDDWKRIADLSKRHMQYLQQFGLTPSSRARVRVVPALEPDELEELLSSKSRWDGLLL
jgi:phage terminase small subunit